MKIKLSSQFILICFLLMTGNKLLAQNYSFQKNIFENYSISRCKETPDGGFALISEEQLSKVRLIRTEKNGAIRWAKELNPINHSIEILEIFNDDDNGFLLAGKVIESDSTVNGKWKILLIKTDSSGNIVFTKKYCAPSNISTHFSYFDAKLYNDDIYFVGRRENSQQYPLIISIHKDGNLNWCTMNENISWFLQTYTSLTFTRSSIFCVGEYQVDDLNGGMLVSNYNYLGDLIWSKVYLINSDYWLNVWDAEVSGDGFMYIGGVYNFPVESWNPWNPALLKMDTAGDLIWINTYDGDYLVAETFDLVITNDNNVIQELEIEGFNNTNPTGALKTNQVGKVQWVRVYDDDNYDFPRSLEINEDQSISISGQTWGEFTGGFLIKTNTDYTTDCNDTLIQVETKHFDLVPMDLNWNIEHGATEDTFSVSTTTISIIPDTTFCIDEYEIHIPPIHPIDSCVYFSYSIASPNPSDDFINIDLKSECTEDRNILVYNDIGQLILEDDFSLTNRYVFQKNIFAAGIYLYVIEEKVSKQIISKGKLVFF